MTARALVVGPNLSIPRAELEFRASRAGGPGGQHVNTSSTRVQLFWNVPASAVLTAEQRALLAQRLGARIDRRGTVRVAASAYRSQARNREAAEERLAQLLRRALAVAKPRLKTRPGQNVAEARLRAKRVLSEKKRRRRELDTD